MQIEQQEREFPRLRVILRMLVLVPSLVGTISFVAMILAKAQKGIRGIPA